MRVPEHVVHAAEEDFAEVERRTCGQMLEMRQHGAK